MARTEIKDLDRDETLDQESLDHVRGGAIYMNADPSSIKLSPGATKGAIYMLPGLPMLPAM